MSECKPFVPIVLGTRREAIKLAPVILAFQAAPDFRTRVVVAGQHREMVRQAMGLFGLKVFYEPIPVGHVDALLRTGNLFDPFLEEANRRLIPQLAHLHFAPTEVSAANCRPRGVIEEMLSTGNTVIDAVLQMVAQAPTYEVPGLDRTSQRVILVNVHRRENWGERLGQIGSGFLQLLERFLDTALLLLVHRDPTVRELLQALRGHHPRASLTEPRAYNQLVPVLRRTTERPEADDSGTARLIGSDSPVIVVGATTMLTNGAAHEAMTWPPLPFWGW